MHSSSTDCRCKRCNALLAKKERTGISIRRGELQAMVTGTDFTASIVCYRCHTLTVVTHAPGQHPSLTAA
jgi:hypothetical protein